jgi:2-hydroxychromene-2-carboxylate isomerase
VSGAGAIDFYFEFSSPYGYIAAELAEDLENRIGRPLRWRPMLLGPIFKITGQPPLIEIPLKGDYARRDFVRSARQHGIQYNHPAKFPIGTVAALRAFYWVDDQRPGEGPSPRQGALPRLLRTRHRHQRAAAVVEIAKSLGVDGTALAAALDDPGVKERAKKEVEAAIAAGVFGSPYFIVDGEPFWGWIGWRCWSSGSNAGGW